MAVLYAVIMFGFHWGVMLTMGIPFIYHLYRAAFAAFIPWEKIRFAGPERSARQPTEVAQPSVESAEHPADNTIIAPRPE